MNAPSQFTARAVLGCLLSAEPLPERDVERLFPELFIEDHDQLIFRTWRDLIRTGGAADHVGVLGRLSDLGQLGEVGGQSYVVGLVGELATVANFGAYVERLHDEHDRRRLSGIAERMSERLGRGESPTAVAGEALRAIGTLEGLSADAAKGRGLQASPLAEVQLDLEGRYVVKGVVSRDSVALVVGPPGSGKTFLVADLALSVAAGLAWREHRVQKGAVLYLAAENPRSLKNRALAWCDHHRTGRGLPFYIASGALSLRQDAGRVIDLARRIESDTGEAMQLVIVDTLSRAFGGGDENSASDMGAVVVACDEIRRGTGACVLLVHHSGKDATRGARGSSALEAACDTVISVADKLATAHKQRDAETGGAMPFRLEPVVLGEDEDGDAVTTCIVVHVDTEGNPAARRPRLSDAEANALSALHEVLDDRNACRTAPPGHIEFGAHVGQQITNIETWRQRCYARMGDRASDTKRKAFTRAMESLMAKGRIQCFSDDVWLA